MWLKQCGLKIPFSLWSNGKKFSHAYEYKMIHAIISELDTIFFWKTHANFNRYKAESDTLYLKIIK